MNREQILNLKVGDKIERSLLGTGHFTLTTITEIFAQSVNVKNQAYACIYTDFGDNSQISGSVTEGDSRYFRLP